MTRFTRSDDLQGAEFAGADLRTARFTACDLSGVVMRGNDVQGMEIDSPWLFDTGGSLIVNGVDVVPLVDAVLDRRFPGRAGRRATDPAGLRDAWEALQTSWATVLERVEAMPAGTTGESVGGEWSFTQTLRHLIMATDTWLGRAILQREQPYHPLGLANAGAEREGLDLSVFATVEPTYAEVLDARADRVAMVRAYLATVTSEELARPCTNPWAPQFEESTLSCLRTILDEEWEHHRYAVRDLDAIEAAAQVPPPPPPPPPAPTTTG